MYDKTILTCQQLENGQGGISRFTAAQNVSIHESKAIQIHANIFSAGRHSIIASLWKGL